MLARRRVHVPLGVGASALQEVPSFPVLSLAHLLHARAESETVAAVFCAGEIKRSGYVLTSVVPTPCCYPPSRWARRIILPADAQLSTAESHLLPFSLTRTPTARVRGERTVAPAPVQAFLSLAHLLHTRAESEQSRPRSCKAPSRTHRLRAHTETPPSAAEVIAAPPRRSRRRPDDDDGAVLDDVRALNRRDREPPPARANLLSLSSHDTTASSGKDALLAVLGRLRDVLDGVRPWRCRRCCRRGHTRSCRPGTRRGDNRGRNGGG